MWHFLTLIILKLACMLNANEFQQNEAGKVIKIANCKFLFTKIN
jgi:hypothetical protein